jgi:hypothetical protein
MRNECSLISCLTEEQHSWLTCFPKHEERGPRFLPHRSHARWPAEKKVDAGAKEMRQHDQQILTFLQLSPAPTRSSSYGLMDRYLYQTRGYERAPSC